MMRTSDLSVSRVPKAVGVFLAVTVLLPVVVAGTALSAYLFLPLPTPELPPPNPGVEASRITRIYDATGQEIGLLRKFDTKIPVQQSDIPEVLKQAVVATEDQRFYSHSGIDIRGAIRAFWADVQNRTIVQGGSTITQQYVKSVYTGGERTFARKLKEAVIASRLDRRMDKDEILFRYLSNVYFGGGAYGAGAAAESYFKKPVNDLSLSESALLASVIRAPSQLEPRGHPAEAEAGRVRVLGEMLHQGRISQAEYDEAVQQRVVLVGTDAPADGPATFVQPLELQSATEPYFVDSVRRYLSAKYGDDVIYKGGLRVETSLDPRLQDLAEQAVGKSLEGTSPPLEMALVTVEPHTGFVKALVGGRDFAASQVNLALGNCPDRPVVRDAPVCLSGGGTGRQPGSAFKPITLAKAFESGIGPGRVYSGPSAYTFPNCTGDCTVHNVESGGYGAIALREATAYSVNTVYAQLILDVGVPETAEMAHRLGLTMISPDGVRSDGEPYGASLTLGSGETSPYDMAGAFAVFANRGLQQPATPVVKVTDANGNVLEDNTQRKPRRVLSEAVADNINDVLKGVVEYGTGTNADVGRPNGTAGKTGTSENFGDAWFVGYTPHLSTAVWMGHSDSREKPLRNIKGTGIVYGGTIPARTWGAFMGEALKTAPQADFAPPVALAGDIGAGARRTPEETQQTTPVQIVQVPLPTLPPFPTIVTAPRPVVPTTLPRPVVPTTMPLFTLPTTTTIPLPGRSR
ncbi:MAG: penicillin-binding protein [Actinomycetota bacterium]|nr:penicillin-binding protein [Actinomycetota bacterium]